MNKRYILLFITLTLVFIGFDNVFAQKKGDVSTRISFGEYRTSDGDEEVSGTIFRITLSVGLTENWAYYGSLSQGRATGTHENSDGSETDISASTTSLGAGIQWHMVMGDKPEFSPFVNGGVILQRYYYDFDYEGSEMGETDGIAFGPSISAGVKIKPTESFQIIPGYHYSRVQVETESGSSRQVESSGITLGVVFSF